MGYIYTSKYLSFGFFFRWLVLVGNLHEEVNDNDIKPRWMHMGLHGIWRGDLLQNIDRPCRSIALHADVEADKQLDP